MRLPNVFTAMADVAMGFLLVHAGVLPLDVLAVLVVSSSCLYTAGMVLNDAFDVEQDLAERPGRPIPSGRISLSAALASGWCLLLIGVLGGWLLVVMSGDWRPAIVSTALAAAIIAYDVALKHTLLGPLAMGSCRMLNVLLGISTGEATEAATGFAPAHWLVAGGIGVYIVGLTWFARDEAGTSRRVQLVLATVVMLAGMAMLWYFVFLLPDEQLDDFVRLQPANWTILWALLGLSAISRSLRAIVRPDSATVQATIKSGILSLIFLDAAVVLAVHGLMPAVGILLLLVPTIILGRIVYST